MTPLDRLVIERNRGFLLIRYLVLAGIVAVAVVMSASLACAFARAINGGLSIRTAIAGSLALALILFLVIALVTVLTRAIYTAVSDKPAIIVSMEGLDVNGFLYSFGTIQWDELEQICPYRNTSSFLFGPRYLMIRFKDTLDLNRYPLAIRGVVRLRTFLSKGNCLMVPERALSATVDEIVRRADEFYFANVAIAKPNIEPEAP